MYHPEIQTDAKLTLSQVRYLRLGWYRFRRDLSFWRPQVLHVSPASPALTQTLTLWRFEELLFLMDFYMKRRTSYQPPQLSLCSFLFARFDSAIVFGFFPQGLHRVVKTDPSWLCLFFKDIITNAHQLTGKRLNLFINSLWFTH